MCKITDSSLNKRMVLYSLYPNITVDLCFLAEGRWVGLLVAYLGPMRCGTQAQNTSTEHNLGLTTGPEKWAFYLKSPGPVFSPGPTPACSPHSHIGTKVGKIQRERRWPGTLTFPFGLWTAHCATMRDHSVRVQKWTCWHLGWDLPTMRDHRRYKRAWGEQHGQPFNHIVPFCLLR